MNFRRRVSLSLLVAATVGFIFSANVSLAQPVVDLFTEGEITVERIRGTDRAIVHVPCSIFVADEFEDFDTTTGFFVNGELVHTRQQTVRQLEQAPPLWCKDRKPSDCPGGACPPIFFCTAQRPGACILNADVTPAKCQCFYESPMDPEFPVPDEEFTLEVVSDLLDEVPELNEANNTRSTVVPALVKVPTVPEWGLIGLIILLGSGGAVVFGRRRGVVKLESE